MLAKFIKVGNYKKASNVGISFMKFFQMYCLLTIQIKRHTLKQIPPFQREGL